MSPNDDTSRIRCHYEILGISLDADTATIKKAHRKLALKHHPDKNHGDDSAAELVQQAYEVLSDPQERKWYDDHRDAILAGWSTGGGDNNDAASAMLFEVVHYMHPGCYSGYHDNKGGFYDVFTHVFEEIVQCERRQSEVSIHLPTEFGNSQTDWSIVQKFYQTWESFVSQLNFAWEDKYNIHVDAPNRRVRRLMEEDNKKARRNAKKTYNQDILALVAFIKRRDPRVKAKQQELEKQKQEKAKKQLEEAAERKRENDKAKLAWREQAQKDIDHLEEADRLAGRVRLADLEDDYDYGGGKKRGKKKKNKKRIQDEEDEEDDLLENEPTVVDDADNSNDVACPENCELNPNKVLDASELPQEGTAVDDSKGDQSVSDDVVEVVSENQEQADDASVHDTSEDEDDEPDFWRCECCRKDFKSEGQMTNHMKSKKHKDNFKKYQSRLKLDEEAIMAEMLDDMDLES